MTTDEQREAAASLNDPALFLAIDQAVDDYVASSPKPEPELRQWILTMLAERTSRGYCPICAKVKHSLDECPKR